MGDINTNIYVISYFFDDTWWYLGHDDFYGGISDRIIMFSSIKQAIDFWEENKYLYEGADLPNLAIRKIICRKKKRLEVPLYGNENC